MVLLGTRLAPAEAVAAAGDPLRLGVSARPEAEVEELEALLVPLGSPVVVPRCSPPYPAVERALWVKKGGGGWGVSCDVERDVSPGRGMLTPPF